MTPKQFSDLRLLMDTLALNTATCDAMDNDFHYLEPGDGERLRNRLAWIAAVLQHHALTLAGGIGSELQATHIAATADLRHA